MKIIYLRCPIFLLWLLLLSLKLKTNVVFVSETWIIVPKLHFVVHTSFVSNVRFNN